MENNDTVRKDECSCGCSTSSEICESKEQNVEKTETCSCESKKRNVYAPAVDIFDSENETLLVADLPGVAENSVDIEIEKNILTIKASQSESDYDEHRLAYAEYGIGDYKRSFSLPADIDKDGISASLKDGVLRVTLPKVSPEAKKITVVAS